MVNSLKDTFLGRGYVNYAPTSYREVQNVLAKAIVFIGSTIDCRTASQILQAEYLPPVTQGDLVRAVEALAPDIIGIIDGSFETVPSVSHKEILWAMSEGIHVFGGGGLGALRAADLIRFGMEGIGRIFQAYDDGTLEDDDEVTVCELHNGMDFEAITEAMVNIRASVQKAVEEEIIGAEFGFQLITAAKATFYKDRTYEALIANAANLGASTMELSSLKTWLIKGKVDQRRLDAMELLQEISDRVSAGLARKIVRFRLERSRAWEAIKASAQ